MILGECGTQLVEVRVLCEVFCCVIRMSNIINSHHLSLVYEQDKQYKHKFFSPEKEKEKFYLFVNYG